MTSSLEMPRQHISMNLNYKWPVASKRGMQVGARAPVRRPCGFIITLSLVI